VPVGSYVARSTNCVGIEGPAFSFADARSSVGVTSDDGHYCVSGTVGAVLNDDWAGRYGAAIAFQPNQQGNNTLPYNAAAHGVIGFTLRLAGNNVPAMTFFQYTVDGEGVAYCKQLSGAGLQRALFSDTHPDCSLGTSTSVPDATRITRMQLLIPALAGADVPFDFCIEDLTAVR
jgi:hypothetical protein